MRGIYKITNKINNKVYIGESLDIRLRWEEHIKNLNENKHANFKLQNDWNEYGKENFEFEILLELDETFKKYVDKYILLIFEDKIMKRYDAINNGYNIENTIAKIKSFDKIIYDNNDCNILEVINNFIEQDKIFIESNIIKGYVDMAIVSNISFKNNDKIFSKIPRELLFLEDDKNDRVLKNINNMAKIILIVHKLQMSATIENHKTCKTSIEDLIEECNYKIDKDVIKNFKDILFELKELKWIDFKNKKLKSGDLIKIKIDELKKCEKYIQLYPSELESILKINCNKKVIANLLKVYIILKSRGNKNNTVEDENGKK